MDEFLQDACMSMHDMWVEANLGDELTPHELHALNDLLDAFFTDKITQNLV